MKNLGTLAVLVAPGWAVAMTGCGDAPICPSDVFVAIQTSEIVTDVDADAEGVQADVEVATSLAADELVALEVRNGDRVLDTRETTVDAAGHARFEAVLVSSPSTTLRVALSTECGVATDERTIEVLAGTGCTLSFDPPPDVVPDLAPRSVLSVATDPDPATPLHPLAATVRTRAGWTVELARVDETTSTTLVTTSTAGPDGAALFDDALTDGNFTYRATCHGPGFSVRGVEHALLVDTTPPVCRLVTPYPGSSVTPAYDRNATLADGIQLDVVGEVSGADIDRSEPVALVVTDTSGMAATFIGAPLDDAGRTTIPASLAPPSTPASFTFSLRVTDRARNACVLASTADYDVVHDGCDIAFVSPTDAVTADANATANDGSQIDIGLQVGPACAGRTVTAECGGPPATATLPADGRITLRTTACATAPCEASLACTASVSTTSDVTTTAATSIRYDTQGPATSLELVAPAVPCGATLTNAADLEPTTPGLQIRIRVTSPDAITRDVDVSSASSTVRHPVTTDEPVVTLAKGTNHLVGSGLDDLGNRGSSPTCTLVVPP